MSFSLANQAERDEWSLWQVWVRGEVHAGICWRDIRRGDNLENLGTEGRTELKHILKKVGLILRSRSSSLCVGSNGGMIL